ASALMRASWSIEPSSDRSPKRKQGISMGPLACASGFEHPLSFFIMSNNYQATYDRLCQHMREAAILNSMQGLLGWYERTNLPPAGGEYRAEQMSYLAGVIHKKQTAPEVGEWLTELIDSPLAADRHSDTGADIINLKRDHDRKSKLPQALVEELAKLEVLGQQMWVEARK